MALWDNAACMELDRALAAQGIRYSAPTLGSTLGSPPGGNGHTAGSNHYPEWWGGPRGSTGQARDYGDRASDCNRIAEFFEQFARGPNYIISELIWTRSKWPLSRNGIYYKRGVAYTPSFTLARQHNDHDHVAIAVGRHLPAWVFRGQVITLQPVPVPPRKKDRMEVAKGHLQNAEYATNWTEKQWIENETIRIHALKDSDSHQVLTRDQGWIDSIPLAGIAPPGYNGQYVERHQ